MKKLWHRILRWLVRKTDISICARVIVNLRHQDIQAISSSGFLTDCHINGGNDITVGATGQKPAWAITPRGISFSDLPGVRFGDTVPGKELEP